MTLDLRILLRKDSRSCGSADVSTTVVVTFSGVPGLGGIVMGGRTDMTFDETKLSRTKEAMMELFPTSGSPQTHICTGKVKWLADAK